MYPPYWLSGKEGTYHRRRLGKMWYSVFKDPDKLEFEIPEIIGIRQ